MRDINISLAKVSEDSKVTGVQFSFIYPFTIRMPCGMVYVIKSPTDFWKSPTDFWQNLPCPCGNPNHWIIQWTTTQEK